LLKNPKEPPSQRTKTQKLWADTTRPRKNKEGITAPTKNWRFSASYDSFVVNKKLVLRMKFIGENRQLLVAANLQVVKKPNFNIYLQKKNGKIS
jgi:hypothetical protein